MVYCMIILCVISTLMKIHDAIPIHEYPKLLIVSYDGFRYDYFNREVTPFMNELREKGTYTDHMKNAFVTKTFPNHHTIATGFYTESHGVIDATVYVDNKTIGDSAQLFQYDKNILPIWTINEQAAPKRHSGTVMWPGSQYEYNGTRNTFIKAFDLSVPWTERIDSMITWFLHPLKPINFGVLYIEEPDFHGHAYGVNAPIINEMLKKLDNITKYLHNKLKENGLEDVNVVHVSDHGMVSVTLEKVVNITSYIGKTGYTAVSKTTIILITPDPGNEDIIYEKLKAAATETSKFLVYKRADIPKRFHFSNNTRVGDILVTAKNGYAFEALYNAVEYYEKTYNITVNNQTEFGEHGYDNEDSNMHPIFFARGPAFVSQCELEPFDSVDLFPMFCTILELNCNVVNGTVQKLRKCLKVFANEQLQKSDGFVWGIGCLIGAVLAILCFLTYRYVRGKKDAGRINRRLYKEQSWDEL